MRNITDSQLRILKEEYPYVNFDTDSDIERYFELWKTGKQKEALVLYNMTLRRKFPDDAVRAELLRCYRLHNPKFKRLLYESILILAEKIEKRVKYVISILTEKIDGVDMADAYSVIRFSEHLLSMISSDRMKAISFTEKYSRYAALLDFRPVEMKRTAELIRMYVTETVESVQDLKRERQSKQHAEKKEKASAPPAVDFSQITFSDADVAKIVIPSNISRIEDSVIAYCLKYWNVVFDAAFERIIVLYSKKYRTKHSEVFFAIKNGREHGWRDEEILNAVLSAVVSGYYYSITGDLYLQRMWRYYKASVGIEPKPLALPAPEQHTPAIQTASPKVSASEHGKRPETPEADKQTDVEKSAERGKPAAKRPVEARNAARVAPKKRLVGESRDARKNAGFVAETEAAEAADSAAKKARKRTSKKGAAAGDVKSAGERKTPFSTESGGTSGKHPVNPGRGMSPEKPHADAGRGSRHGKRAVPHREKTSRYGKPPENAVRPESRLSFRSDRSRAFAARPHFPSRGKSEPNSVADIIKRISGETYTVYREMFFQEIRSSIRGELSSCAIKKGGRFFGIRQNEAEDIVFNYLEAHYDDPYQNWETSGEKTKIESLGFRLKSIDSVIKRWVVSNRRKSG